jgi:nifR3 family TIM-barrel protein
MGAPFDLDGFFAARPVICAPMEDVSDAAFRRVVRARGASLCVTEFAMAGELVAGAKEARRKIALAEDDTPTAIQIYGGDAAQLAEAAGIAEQAGPAYLDVNCGCWAPKVVRSGAGAAWLRDPAAMVAMARMVVARVALPVTVKTRIGFGPESLMPIVDLARRLEDAGVRAITVHCRTAEQGYEGRADWRWAMRAREAVSIPVVVNGDVRSGDDARRALAETGCAGVMIGRRAIEHPWIFRESRSRIDGRGKVPPPTVVDRVALCLDHLAAIEAEHGPRRAVRTMRRFYAGYLGRGEAARTLVRRLLALVEIDAVRDALDGAVEEIDALTDAADQNPVVSHTPW